MRTVECHWFWDPGVVRRVESLQNCQHWSWRMLAVNHGFRLQSSSKLSSGLSDQIVFVPFDLDCIILSTEKLRQNRQFQFLWISEWSPYSGQVYSERGVSFVRISGCGTKLGLFLHARCFSTKARTYLPSASSANAWLATTEYIDGRRLSLFGHLCSQCEGPDTPTLASSTVDSWWRVHMWADMSGSTSFNVNRFFQLVTRTYITHHIWPRPSMLLSLLSTTGFSLSVGWVTSGPQIERNQIVEYRRLRNILCTLGMKSAHNNGTCRAFSRMFVSGAARTKLWKPQTGKQSLWTAKLRSWCMPQSTKSKVVFLPCSLC